MGSLITKRYINIHGTKILYTLKSIMDFVITKEKSNLKVQDIGGNKGVT